jgi:fibronectin-binding autotransporter adhesin
LNYVGKFDATLFSDDPGAHSPAYFHVDHVPAHAPADAILVSDAQLLFHGDFKRSGVDLILSNDDREFVLHDYFKGEKRAALASPDGAHLTGDLVNALTGEVQYSQAGGAVVDHQVIGHITKLQGSATAIRNGVSIILNMGDNVEKGDVVQSGSDSTLGVTFIDGTVFGLSSNARMVLNEMVYDPNGSNNSSLLSLVAGTITFVAGETAKHGDMKIDTPVATMGIRGTAVLVEIDFTVPGQGATPDAKFQVLVEPDGTTGSYILFDKITLQPIAMVNTAGQQINISNGVISQSSTPLSPDIQKLITDVFSLKFSDANTNTKTTTAQTDTINPDLFGPTFKLASGAIATPVFLIVNPGSGNDPASSNPNGGLSLQHIPGPPIVVSLDASGKPTTGFGVTELAGKTGDATDHDIVVGKVNFADINAGDQPTVKADFSSFTYQNAQHQDVTAKLNAPQLADIAKTAIKLVVVPDSGNNNNGNSTLTYSVPDKAFDFLAAGETLTLTYLVRVDNNYAPSDEFTIVPITITITGTNDAPAITTSAQTINFSGGTSVPGGDLTSSDPTSGTMTFTDVDLTDTHSVSTALTSAVLSGGSIPPLPLKLFEDALSASITADSTGTGTGTVNWKLADLPVYLADFIPKGQTLALTYTITVTDSQGATSTQTVTVDITGTSNPAVVWIHTTGDGSPDGLWSTAQNWETGTVPTATDDVIIITNQLIGLTPVYPVTIDLPALAKSVTMNDFGMLFANSPTLINQSTLTVGSGGISLSADSIIENDKSATISVAGQMEVLDQSSLQNYGQITLQGGGDFKDQSTITNFASGTIEVASGTLNVLVDVANSGLISVDAGATMALDAGTIDGGTVTINGTLNLEGASFLKNGTLTNRGKVDVSGTVTFDKEAVANMGAAAAIDITGALTLRDAASIANVASNTETVESTGSLTLQDTSFICGGTVSIAGTLDLEGTSFLRNGILSNTGQINVSGIDAFDNEAVTNTGAIDITGALTLLDHASIGNGVSNTETVHFGASLTLKDTSSISGGNLINLGNVYVEASSGATFNGVSVDNSGGTIHVDTDVGPPPPPTATLILDDGTTISGGKLTIGSLGVLDVETGPTALSTGTPDATLDGVTVANGGNIDVGTTSTSDPTLLLDDGTTISAGKLTLGNLGVLDVETGPTILRAGMPDATLDGVTVANGGNIDVGTTGASDPTLLLDHGTTINGGKLTLGNLGVLDVETGPTALGAGTPDATLDGVTVVNGGNIDVGATSTSDPTLLLDHGTTISGGKLTLGSLGVLDVETGPSTFSVGTADATLDNVSVSGGGTIEVGLSGAATLTLTDGANTNNVAVTIGRDSTLDLDGSTINGGLLTVSGMLDSTGSSFITGASIVNPGNIEVTSGTLTIDPTPVTNTGTILVTDDSTLVLNGETVTNSIPDPHILAVINGTIQVDATDATHVSTLDLESSTIDGGIVKISGVLESTGTSFIDKANINNSGTIDVTGGTLTIDAASSLTNTGTLEADGGTLFIKGDVSGAGAATTTDGGTLDFGGADAQTVTFDGAGTLKLEASANFTGTISGLATGDVIDLAGTVVTAAYFDGSTLLVNGQPTSFQISSLPAGDTVAFKSDGSGGTDLKVLPQVLAVGSPSPVTGVEGAAIQLDFSDTVTGASLSKFVISGIPDGAVVSDGTPGHSYISGSADGSVDAASWKLSSLTITPANDANFTLSAIVTAVDSNGFDYTLPATEVVTVNPSAPTVSPVAESGTEGKPIALDLGTTVNGLSGDSNSLASLVVSAIPVGATLSDGHDHSFTATPGNGDQQVDVHGWDLSALTITLAHETNFKLGVAATEKDANGDLSATTTGTEAVTVYGHPTILGESDPATQTIILDESPVVLAAGVNTNSLGLPTETFDDAGSLSNNGLGHGNFTSSALDAVFSSSGDAGVVNGSSSVSAAPFVGPLPGHVDSTNYLSIGAHGTETIAFASEQNEFGLYWGSVDPTNTIDFYNGTKLVASYTGADISPLLASGGQGSFSSNGYVEFSDLAPFNKVVLDNGNANSFEIDNISAGSISDSHVHLAAPITGTLTVSDDDIGDTLTASVTGDAVVKYNGSTSLPSGINVDALINPNAVTFDSVKADGDADVLHWTYNPTNPDLDFLEPGDTLTIIFNAQVSDGHATAGIQPLTITLVGTGASVVNGTAQNDTFVHVGGGVTIFGNGGNDTFVFNPNFGSATIGDFDVHNDTIAIDRTLFPNVAAILASAQPTNFGHDTIITDAAHDKIVLTGVTVTQLNAHQNDFHLV